MQADYSLTARFCSPPPFAIAGGSKPTAAQRAGLRYEEKVLAYCEGWARANRYSPLAKKWIEYRDHLGRVHWAQPDWIGVSDDTDSIILVEVKIRHIRDAFTQLRMYKRLLEVIYPNYHICPVEICRYFDPDETKTVVLSELRAHNLPHAALIWEPPVVPGLNG